MDLAKLLATWRRGLLQRLSDNHPLIGFEGIAFAIAAVLALAVAVLWDAVLFPVKLARRCRKAGR